MKYLMLKHYGGGPTPVVECAPMDQWTPEEISAHIRFMDDFAKRLQGTGELVDAQGLSPEGTWVRYDGEGRPPVTDGPFAESKELIAGFTLIDVSSRDEALEWVRKWPRIGGEDGFRLELRQVFAAEDFGAELTPELQEREARMRAQTGATPATSSHL